MPRRRYTHAQRAEFVAEAELNGSRQAAAKTGIPRKTGEYWLDQPEFAQLRQKTREEKRDGYRVIIARAQQRLVELIPAMEPRDLTVLLGVAQDKDLLLSGDATARTENRTWTDAIDPDSQRRLRDWALERLDELGRKDEAQGAAEGAGLREPAAG